MPLKKETMAALSIFIRPLRRSIGAQILFLPLLSIIALACIATQACKTAPKPQPPQPPAAEQAANKNPDEPTRELPPDLFKSMPVYPGATVEHVHKPKGAMREIAFATSAQLNQVVQFYKDELKKNDFHITSSLIMPARKTWSCDFHREGRPATLMVYPDDKDKSKLVIDLIYEMPAKADASLQEAEETFDVIGPGEVAQQAVNSNTKAKRN